MRLLATLVLAATTMATISGCGDNEKVVSTQQFQRCVVKSSALDQIRRQQDGVINPLHASVDAVIFVGRLRATQTPVSFLVFKNSKGLEHVLQVNREAPLLPQAEDVPRRFHDKSVGYVGRLNVLSIWLSGVPDSVRAAQQVLTDCVGPDPEA